jgi:hypothetical protein
MCPLGLQEALPSISDFVLHPWWISVQELHTSTYWYVPVRTLNKTCGFLIHPGSALSVKYNSVQLLCKRYVRMMSNFKTLGLWCVFLGEGMLESKASVPSL